MLTLKHKHDKILLGFVQNKTQTYFEKFEGMFFKFKFFLVVLKFLIYLSIIILIKA